MSTRCSTARGPARSPSLVTCPTRRNGTPLDLAIRVRRSTQARTWARLPAGWASSGSEIDWSESTTTRAGRCRADRLLDRVDVGALQGEQVRAGTGPRRTARPLTWASDSSAEASMTSRPRRATEERTWKSRVDLPMPGGPNSRVTEPPTTPPPMTRSSSLTPVGIGRAAVGRDFGEGDGAVPRARPRGPAGAARTDVGTAASVFHSPHAGQRPTQRNEVVPHAPHS